MATTGLTLVETPPGKRECFWGVNGNTGFGYNMLGQLHMKLRNEIENKGYLSWFPRTIHELYNPAQNGHPGSGQVLYTNKKQWL